MYKVEMEIEERVFTGNDGKEVKYISYRGYINGEYIKFQPKADDKKLCEFLLSGEDLTPED